MSAFGVVANRAVRLVIVPPRHRTVLMACLAQNPLERQSLICSLPSWLPSVQYVLYKVAFGRAGKAS